MSECTNGELRDLLPELMHGTLDAEMRGAVEAHVASCAECAEELALLRSLRVALEPAPRVDVQRIAAAVNARTMHGAAHRARPRSAWRLAIAAAALVAVSGIGYAVVARHAGAPSVAVAPAPAVPASARTPAPIVAPPQGAPPRVAVAPSHAVPSTARAIGDDDAGADVIGNLADLSDADVRALSASLDKMSAVPDADPGPVVDPLDASLDDQSGGGR
jgi:anti-sigma factor RsiW